MSDDANAPPPAPSGAKRLTGTPDLRGWKEIAGFLGISVRQAQDFAIETPPPGHNVLPCYDSIWGKAAWSSELQTWAKLRLHSHQVGVELKRARRSRHTAA